LSEGDHLHPVVGHRWNTPLLCAPHDAPDLGVGVPQREVPVAVAMRLEVTHFASNPQRRKSALDQVLSKAGFLPSTKSFLSLLVDKGRMNVLLPILGELRRMVEELEGIERVEVSVPMPMPPSQKEMLKAMLERRTGKKVVLEETVDPAVLGGLVVRVGSTVYDGSVRTQIRQIRENLQKG
jgi:F-type H+-transporting ATPase subunit delta